MEILIKASQFILSLSILIVLHELGHFIPARLFKTRVEKFYLFFDPWFSLFKIKRGETEYGIGWVPLGGYVKIAGMIDESMDKEQMKQAPQEWEFRSKPAWQRLIIMLGGVSMNVILAIIIFIFSLFIWGENYLATKNVSYGIACDSLALASGFKDGDKIQSVDGKPLEDFNKIIGYIVLNESKTVQVERNGQQIDIPISEDVRAHLVTKQSFFDARLPFEVAGFLDETNDSALDQFFRKLFGGTPQVSPAKLADMKENDKVIGLNEINIEYFHEFKREIVKHKNEEVKVKVLRNSDTLAIALKVPENGVLGIYNKNPFVISQREYSFIEAIPAGIASAYNKVRDYVRSLKLLFSPKVKAYESLGGFGSIANLFPARWDWQSFWYLTAFLSIMLAVMNLLPIPALDGGHVMFLFYEIIFRRKPNEKFMEYAQLVGMVLLLSLILFANGNDIYKAIFK